jgi:hypothetical protein
LDFTGAQQQAVAQITWDDGEAKIRGTGFLISDQGHLLTAAHVLRGFDAKQKSIWVRFDGKAELSFDPQINPVEVAVSRNLDWAVLKLPALAGVAPLVFGCLQRTEVVNWAAFGYPANDGAAGGSYAGSVRVETGTRLELSAEDTEKRRLVRGLSGGPCFRDGYVIGVVIETRETNGESDGRFWVLRSEAIAEELRAFLPTQPALQGLEGALLRPNPPFTDDAAQVLRNAQVSLRKVAQDLDLPIPEVALDAEARLHLHLAAHALGAGIPTTADVGGALNRTSVKIGFPEAAGLLEFAALQWLDPVAVDFFCKQFEQDGVALVLNGTPNTARLFLRYADPSNRFILGRIDYAPSTDAELVGSQLAELVSSNLGCEVGQLNARAKGLRKLIVLVTHLPDQAVFEEILRFVRAVPAKSRWVLVAGGAAEPSELARKLPGSIPIDPEVKSAIEAAEREAAEFGLLQLQRAWSRKT